MSVCPTPPDSYVEALTVTVAMFITCEEVIEICEGLTQTKSVEPWYDTDGVGGGYWKDMTTDWSENRTQAVGGFLLPPPSLKCNFCPLYAQSELFSRTQPSETHV